MALPQTVNPSAPAGSDSPAQGDDEFRALKQYLVDVYGAPNNSAVTAAALAVSTGGVVTVSQSPLNVPTLVRGAASQILQIESRYSSLLFLVEGHTSMALGPSHIALNRRYLEWTSGITGVLGTRGSQPLILRSNTLDRWQVDPSGMLLPLASSMDIGQLAGPNPRNLYVSSNVILSGQLQAGTAPRIVTTPTGMLDARELTLPSEARGDVLTRGASTWTRLAVGATGRVLKSAGAGADLTWDTLDVSDVSSAVTLATAQTISGQKTFSAAPIITSQTGLDFAAGSPAYLGTTDTYPLRFKTNGLERWGIDTSGMLVALTDAVFDVGRSGGVRPRDVYLSGDLYSGSNRLTSGNELDAAQLVIASEAQGDVLIRSSAAWTRLAAGTSGQLLRTRGATADPLWVTGAQGVGVDDSPVAWTGTHSWSAGVDMYMSSPSVEFGLRTSAPTAALDVRGIVYLGGASGRLVLPVGASQFG